MKISRIMYVTKTLMELCAVTQKIKTKNTFADIDLNALAVKTSCKSLKKFI